MRKPHAVYDTPARVEFRAAGRSHTVHEIALVFPDLYFPRELERDDSPALALPGLEHITRFGQRSGLPQGWRPWLANWAGSPELASLPPALVAARIAACSTTPTSVAGASLPGGAVWMATPVHLVASLTSLHLDRRSVLYLADSEELALCADFARTFQGSGYHLTPLEGGGLLLFGAATSAVETCEPARAIGENVAERLPSGPGAAALRKLGAEIEMWLHGHPLNEARLRRGELGITSLWLWGGGESGELARLRESTPAASARARVAFGSDASLRALWAHIDAKVQPLPPQLAQILSYPAEGSAVLVIEAGRMLHSNQNWMLPEALAEIDRQFLAPAVQALQHRQVGVLEVLANDWRVSVRATDRLRLWRRARPGLSGLR